jgi:hypothetical protein
MKYALQSIAANLVSLGMVASAGCMAMNDKPGWGWFLLVAMICYTTLKSTPVKVGDEIDAG